MGRDLGVAATFPNHVEEAHSLLFIYTYDIDVD